MRDTVTIDTDEELAEGLQGNGDDGDGEFPGAQINLDQLLGTPLFAKSPISSSFR